MMELAQFIDNHFIVSGLRESPSIFAYPTLVAFHSFGMVLLVGITTAISLRTLGFAPDLPLAPLDTFFRFVWIGFWISAVTGVVLLSLDLIRFLTMPAFYLKLFAIAGAVVSVRLLRNQLFGDSAGLDTKPIPMEAKILASISLICWAVAITAGRVTAYVGWIQRQTAVAVFILAVVMLAGAYFIMRFWGSEKPVGKVGAAVSTH